LQMATTAPEAKSILSCARWAYSHRVSASRRVRAIMLPHVGNAYLFNTH
jgi:hypothetical protein